MKKQRTAHKSRRETGRVIIQKGLWARGERDEEAELPKHISDASSSHFRRSEKP